MTIDEAIEKLKYDFEIDMYIHDIAPQLAEWLEELKSYRASVFSGDMTQTMLKEQYCKAIDDLIDKLAEYEDFEEIFREKMTDTACEFLKDKEEFGLWLDRNKWDAKKCDEYARAEEQGLLLRLPCPIGTTVYNTTCWDDVTEKVEVNGETLYRIVHKHKVSKSTFSLGDIYNFGKTVFLTQAEAEQKLKEMESD